MKSFGLSDRLSPNRSFGAGRGYVRGHQLNTVSQIQRSASLPVVFGTEGHDIPGPIQGTVELNVSAHFGLFQAALFGAIPGNRLLAVFDPMVEPATTSTGSLAGSVYVVDSHRSNPPLRFSGLTGDANSDILTLPIVKHAQKPGLHYVVTVCNYSLTVKGSHGRRQGNG